MAKYLQYGGNRGVILKDPGTLETDYTGLSSGTAVFTTRQDNWAAFPKTGSIHPVFSFLALTHSSVSLNNDFATCSCEYKGASVPSGEFTTPTYELVVGLTEEPIETHPDFTKLAGTPVKPKNGAVFQHLETGRLAYEGREAPSDNGYVFVSWRIGSDFFGVERFLDVGNVTWRETRIGRVSGSAAISNAGTIENPRGPYPNLRSGRNWLNMGTTITIEGMATRHTTDWRASGPRGWNKKIYNR